MYEVRDSVRFADALSAWAPLVRQHRATPRALKRFVNRIRYLAMLRQAEELDETGRDAVRDTIRRWARLHSAPPGPQTASADAKGPNAPIYEDQIVAFGALYEVYGKEWRDLAKGEFTSEIQKTEVEDALQRYRDAGGSLRWPATDEELDSFELSLKGIRLSSV